MLNILTCRVHHQINDIINQLNKEAMNKYEQKRARLLVAIQKAQTMLKEHAAGIRPVETWNNVHDLEDRLTDRFNDNESDYADYMINTGQSYSYGNLAVIF